MAAATVEVALVAKLKATPAVTNLVAGRIYPQLNTQEPTFPLIVYTILGSEGGQRLSGSSHALRKWTVQVDCYAATEAAAGALAKAVRDALAPDGSPWVSAADGVQGCFFVDSSEDFTEDGIRFQSETFDIWHKPT